ncbi:hypothetical protein BKA70DRAFT_1527777 [Coprinopsis sp. MPI-PUGE-AT-0042]|nr:hypothetical protein BKA70DRAFT_1527777 [Coprinopsis sp. MPI-PUGE-AT-0042]
MDSSASYEQGVGRGTLGEVDFYTRLTLPFEEALTRAFIVPSSIKSKSTSSPSSTPAPSSPSTTTANGTPTLTKQYYNTGVHFLWISEQLTHAHIEYFRGIRNPIGLKLDSLWARGTRALKWKGQQNETKTGIVGDKLATGEEQHSTFPLNQLVVFSIHLSVLVPLYDIYPPFSSQSPQKNQEIDDS